MKRTLTITIDVELADLTDEERAECEELSECEDEDGFPISLPRLKDHEPMELVEPIIDSLPDNEETWAGTGIYAKITSARLVTFAEKFDDHSVPAAK